MLVVRTIASNGKMKNNLSKQKTVSKPNLKVAVKDSANGTANKTVAKPVSKKKAKERSKANGTVQKPKLKPDSKTQNGSMVTSAKIPEKPEDISSNWKRLLETLPPKKAVKRKAPPANRVQKKFKPSEDTPEQNTKPRIETIVEEETIEESEEVWFDGVDEIFLQSSKTNKLENGSAALIKDNAFKGLTKYIAMDCEMVGVGTNDESAVARVSLVNQYGHPVYDKYVQPGEKVTNYRTHVSGIRPADLKNAIELGVVQAEVAEILKGRILVGHALRHDLEVLFINHPASDIRDTSKYKGFRALVGGVTPSLKLLTSQLLGISIQSGEHSSIQDSQAAMRLYTMFRKKWEEDIKQQKKTRLEKKQERQVIKKENQKNKR